MPLVEHHDVIEAFPSNRPDDALSEGILPGRSRGDEDLAHPQAFHPPDEHIAVDLVPVAEQVLGCCLFQEALDQLVSGPGGGGVVGGVDMDEFSTVVSKDQESEEQVEGQGRNDEEIEGDYVANMCLQEGAPRRGWPRQAAIKAIRIPLPPADVRSQILDALGRRLSAVSTTSRKAKRATNLLGRLERAILAKTFQGEP